MKPLHLTGMPAFNLIWAGQFVSLIGSSLMRFAVGIWLYEQTGLATTFTTMIFLASLPRVLLSPVAGALVDRLNRKFTLMVSDLATGLLTIVIFLLLQGDSLSIWHIYVLVALSSAFEAFQFPAYSSAVTLLVGKQHFARASFGTRRIFIPEHLRPAILMNASRFHCGCHLKILDSLNA